MNAPTRAPAQLRCDSAEIRRGIDLLFEPGSTVEVRVPIHKQRTVSGYFDDFAKLAAAIEAAERYGASGIYYTLNPVNPALLGRYYNRLQDYAKYTTSDLDIVKRRWLPVDLDGTRPAGISASATEHEAALERARLIRQEMASEWGPAVLADSGNGAHLLFPIDLPNDADALAYVSGALVELKRRYPDGVVKIDTTSSNSARIWKAYGTTARKGDSIPARPHRISRILEVLR
jgi:hypothetical protein